MARGFKTGGRNFEKGNQARKGKPSLSLEDVEARKLTRLEFERIVNKYLNCNLEQLKAHLKDPETKALDLTVLRVLILTIEKGDQIRLNFLLERTVGKVIERIDHTSSDGTMSPGRVEVMLPSNGKEAKEK